MDPGPHQEHHTHHHSGMRWLDMAVGLSAILISVVSLYVAIQHGKTMEHMVEATTWPYLEFYDSNLDEAGKPSISLTVRNSGVGPARVESLEVWLDGKPIASGAALLQACCAKDGERPNFVSSAVGGRVLPARDTVVLFRVNPEFAAADQWDRLDAMRSHLRGRLCYCSVLDECWIRDTLTEHPERTKTCPKPAVPYDDNHRPKAAE